MELFLFQMHHQNIKIHAWGFFDVDYSIIQTVSIKNLYYLL